MAVFTSRESPSPPQEQHKPLLAISPLSAVDVTLEGYYANGIVHCTAQHGGAALRLLLSAAKHFPLHNLGQHDGTYLRTLLSYVGAFVALAIAVMVVAQLGESIRDVTPPRLHAPLSVVGAALVVGTIISLAFKASPFSIDLRTWRTSMAAGLITGLLLFFFYSSDVECKTTGRSVSCRYVGPGALPSSMGR